MTISLLNAGPGIAANSQITGIGNITVLSGTGPVTLSSNNVFPALAGTLAKGQQAPVTVNFMWPSTASRVQFTVQYSANGGAVTGSTTLGIYR